MGKTALLAMLLAPTLAQAATRLVPGQYPNIQAAIDACTHGDTVVVAPGTYTGDGNRDIDFKGKAITVRSQSGPEDCVIDCNGTENDQHRGFYFHSGEDANSLLDGFRITNGLHNYGGAVCCSDSSPRIIRCRLTGNSAHHGGALYLSGSSPTIIDCLIDGNLAYAVAGVIMIPGQGPGIYCSSYRSHPIINNCTITNNYGPDGGGISCRGGSPKITNCILWANSAPQVAGGTPDVTFCDIQGGWPGEGNIDADPCFLQPGHWNAEGIYYLLRGSPCIDGGTNEPNIGLAPADIIGNPRLVDGDADGVAVVDLGAYEHAPNIPAIDVSVRQFTFRAVRGRPNPEPQVLNIANAAGGILNWRITSDCNWLSAEPNSGSSAQDLDPVLLSVDIAGLPGGDHFCSLQISDPNAVNSPLAASVVLRLGNLLRVPSEYPTIQDAVDAAADCDLVLVADGVYTGDGNRDIDFLGKSISVRSENGPEKCIIDCNASATSEHRAFYFFHREEGPESVVDGFTIMNGRMPQGAAIFCYNSSPTITGCIIKDNYARTGGAIFCLYARPEIHNCIIAANSAEYEGGAIACDGLCITFSGCTLAANTALYGGAAACNGAKAIFKNCTFVENIAHYGSAINCRDRAALQLANCIIFDNRTYYTPPSYPPPGPRVPPDVPDWGLGLQVRADEESAVSARHCNVQGGLAGLGNIDADPCFVAPGCWTDPNDPAAVVEPNYPNALWVPGDYHLKSAGWRWDQTRRLWTWDEVTSPCIDAGNPGYPLADEPLSVFEDPKNLWGRNLRIDMGAYGGTPQASIPPHNWSLAGDYSNDGIVNLADLACWLQARIDTSDLLSADLDRTGRVDSLDLASLADDWLARTSWFDTPRPVIPSPPLPPDPPYPPLPPPKPRACFPSDTLVWVDGSLVPIPEVGAGQKVGRLDCLARTSGMHEIEEVQEHEGTYDCYDVVLATGESITVADEHYFLVDAGCERWVSVHDLKPGSILKSLSGPVGVTAVIKRPVPLTGRVYNLKIKDSDRYFVGSDGITVRDY
jgi:hypothetical protein